MINPADIGSYAGTEPEQCQCDYPVPDIGPVGIAPINCKTCGRTIDLQTIQHNLIKSLRARKKA